jgi:hypothetical protein
MPNKPNKKRGWAVLANTFAIFLFHLSEAFDVMFIVNLSQPIKLILHIGLKKTL